MNVLKALLLFSMAASPLWGTAPDSLPLQQLRAVVEELTYKTHAQETYQQLLEERMRVLEEKLARESKVKPEGNVTADLKLLKSHLEAAEAGLAQCEKRLTQLDKQVDKDLSALKATLQSMLALLKGEGEKRYTVKSGDSLGHIALENKTSTKVLKELNNLSSDTIFVGQQLTLP